MSFAVGIVAEYNPFHNGHAHQIREIRAHYPDSPIIAVLSSSFVQRGLPALLDKWERAKAAVMCGVDLVIELPLPFCCHNAGVFASAAVTLFKATGAVSCLSFGMESPNLELLNRISSILVQEPLTFKADLQFFLKTGLSYADARARAAECLCPGARELMEQPNNALALAYVEASIRQNARFSFLPVSRRGAGYRDVSEAEIMSASGIRAALLRGDVEASCASMPAASAQLLRNAWHEGRVCTNTLPLWQALRLLFMRSPCDDLARFAGMTEGIENRFERIYPECTGFEELIEKVSTRRYPMSRVRRTLMSFLLNITSECDMQFQKGGPAYIRPLAMSLRGRELIHEIRTSASLPVIYKPAMLKGNSYGQKIFSLGVRASRIWESLLPSPDYNREIRGVPYIGKQQ